MKKLVLALTAVSALAAAAVPAAAQSYGAQHHGGQARYDHRLDHRADLLQWRIERAEQRRQIDRRQASQLKSQVRTAETLARRYQADGRYTAWERNEVQKRLAAVSVRLDRVAGRDYGRYGR